MPECLIVTATAVQFAEEIERLARLKEPLNYVIDFDSGY